MKGKALLKEGILYVKPTNFDLHDRLVSLFPPPPQGPLSYQVFRFAEGLLDIEVYVCVQKSMGLLGSCWCRP